MNESFPYAVNARARAFCRRVVEALMVFCNKSEQESSELMQKFWHDLADIESDPFIYEEPPYYYAMCMAHHPKFGDNRPLWYKDTALWPPPQGWTRR